ncbi:hypothetical protein HXX76_006838 [Chlamydomonas incerta]|uniref:Uncharacterized protein n=1 Tax=Chlamydomonas incerta TaxID=51695 RepID=A0A835TCV9_CHLIN|nr:hypothetical protein HXX76_006838 [Chlamydomonas incerta]|eukprot:KAG2435635.1 hypothetical protein HXX76_006838 [Chlamydomonas incerta]
MAVALLFIPLLLLLGHAEVATFGLVVGISRLTGIGVAVAAATRWRSSSTAGSSTSGGSSNRSGSGLGPEDSRAHGNRWAGAAVALGYIVPLPHQVVLQLAAVGAVLLPLGLSLGAAVWSAASGAPCGRWLKASLLYALGLLLPSPGVGRPVQRINLGAQACRALLLWGAGCLVAAEVSAAAAGAAVAGSGVQAAAVVATVARLWLWLAGVMWSLQTLGWLEATVSSW